jgi:hypothetical protein
MKGLSRWCALGVLLLAAGPLCADTVGVGFTIADDFPDVPEGEEIYSRLIASGEIVPGFLVFFTERDWGMSFDFSFDLTAGQAEPGPTDPSWLDFSFAATYDWHPLRFFVLDPFLQLGAGLNMAAPVTEYSDEVRLRFHPVMGAGVNVGLGSVYLRGNIQYQGLSFVIPAPDIEPYEAGPYRVLLSAGFLLD